MILHTLPYFWITKTYVVLFNLFFISYTLFFPRKYALASDGSGTRKPENPTRPEGFFLARTRPEPEKVQTRPKNPKKPEILEK